MTRLARSPASLVVDALQGNGASDASPAVPRSSRLRIERKDLHAVALTTRRRGTPRGPRPWQDSSATSNLYEVYRSRTLLVLGQTLPSRRWL